MAAADGARVTLAENNTYTTTITCAPGTVRCTGAALYRQAFIYYKDYYGEGSLHHWHWHADCRVPKPAVVVITLPAAVCLVACSERPFLRPPEALD